MNPFLICRNVESSVLGKVRSRKVEREKLIRRTIRFWIPAIAGALLTPVCLYLVASSGSASAGAAGHAGAGLGAMLLFYPLPVFLMMFSAGNPSGDAFLLHVISALAFGGMILQFPLYGFIISYANLKRSLWLKLCAGVVWLHIIVIVAGVSIVLIQASLG